MKALVASGFVAVGMFFVLSGFILTYTYGRVASAPRSKRAFFSARFARIYPVYVLSLAIGFAAGLPGTVHQLATAWGCTRLLLVLLLLNAFTHRAMFYLNWAAWSLSAEVFFYVLFPWIGARLARKSDGSLARIALVAWVLTALPAAVYTRMDPDHLGRPLQLGDEVLWSWYLKFFPPVHLAQFVIGICAGHYYLRHAATLRRVSELAIYAALAVLLGAMGWVLVAGAIPYAFLNTGALAPAFALVVLALASGEGRALGLLSSAVVVALGRASYGIYILHVPLYYLGLRAYPPLDGSLAGFVTYLAVLVAVSVLTFRHVEEPARRWLRGALR